MLRLLSIPVSDADARGLVATLLAEGTPDALTAAEQLTEGVERDLYAVGLSPADTLRSTRVHGVVCFTGMLSNEWTVRDFYPIDYLPRGVRLTAYGGDSGDLPPAVLQDFLDAVAGGQISVPVHRRFDLSEIQEAHAYMESGKATGKLVVTV